MSTKSVETRGTPSIRKSFLLLFLLVFLAYIMTASGRIGTVDGGSMFDVTRSIADRHAFNVDPCTLISVSCSPGLNGKHYSAYGFVPSLATVPAYKVAALLAKIVHKSPMILSGMLISFQGCALGGAACVILAMWMLSMRFTLRTSIAVAATLAFATPYWYFSSKGFYSEPYLGLFLIICCLYLNKLTPAGGAWIAGLAMGAGCAARVIGIIAVPSLLYYLWRRSLFVDPTGKSLRRHVVTFLAGLAVFLLAIGVFNFVRFGSFTKSGYQVVYSSLLAPFDQPMLLGIVRMLFDGEIGLIWYCPIALLALFAMRPFLKRRPDEAILISSVAVISILLFSIFRDWHAGWAYGPRYLTPILPLLIAPIGILYEAVESRSAAWKRPLLGAAILLAVGLQVIALPVPMERYYRVSLYDQERAIHHWWSGSCLLYNFVALPQLVGDQSHPAKAPITELEPESAPRMIGTEPSAAAVSEIQYLEELPNATNITATDFWLTKLVYLGISSKIVVATLALSALAFVILARNLARAMPSERLQ